jgi:hypothetical protein
MKNRMLILSITVALGASQMHAGQQKKNVSKPTNKKYIKEARSKLSAKQKKELTDAIMSYRGSLAAIRVKETAGNKASDADLRNRGNQKKIIDKYNRNYGDDPFVVSQMTSLNNRLITVTRPALPAKNQDYYGKLTPPALPAKGQDYYGKKLTPPALPAKNQDYYGKLTSPALPEKGQDYYGKLTSPALPARNPHYTQFMKTYTNPIILPNNEINKDWIARGSEAVRNDLGLQATKATIREELWRLAQENLDDFANSPLNANNPSYKENIKNSFDAAYDEFFRNS